MNDSSPAERSGAEDGEVLSHSGAPTTTVIMPVFNGSRGLERAVRSVLDQTDPDLELVVVDDKSSDDSLVVLHRLQSELDDPRLRVVEHDVNRGVSAARNTGLERAVGELVAFIDCDDEYDPDFVRRMRQAMSPDVDLVVCGRRVCVPGREPYERASRSLGTFPGTVAARLAMTDRITPFACDKMIRRELFRGLGYPEGAARFEDSAANVILHSRSRKVRVIDAPLYVYNIGTTSATWGRIPTMADTDTVLDFVERHLPPELKHGAGRRFHASMRAFVALQVAQSAMARPSRSAEADAVIRDCRRALTAGRVVDFIRVNPVVGSAAALFKLSPDVYAALYRRYIHRSFGIVTTQTPPVAVTAGDLG